LPAAASLRLTIMDTQFVNCLVYDYMSTVDAKLAKKFKKEAKVTQELPPGSPGISDILKHFNETSAKQNKRVLGLTEEESSPLKKAKEDLAPDKSVPSDKELEDSVCDTEKDKVKAAIKNNMNVDSESQINLDGESVPAERSEIFIRNVSKEFVYEDLGNIDQFGEVTNFVNQGRGFCFLTFSSPEAANACIAALNDTEVAGKTVHMRIAREKPEAKAASQKKKVPAERREIFIRNVGKDFVYEDFKSKVEQFGEVTNFVNPGRGFCFLTFSSTEAANACVVALNNTEIAGKTVQMNIARKKTAGSTGKGTSDNVDGCKLFVHGVKQETDADELKTAFEKFGNVTDSFNPGKGFAFVTFSTPEEATAAAEGLNGKEVCGNSVSVNVSTPKVKPEAEKKEGGKALKKKKALASVRIFVNNVSENTSQDDLKAAFSAHGTVTDAYNPGKGFAFVNFATADEAQAAIDALSGQEVCGKEVECNIAKFKKVQKGRGKS